MSQSISNRNTIPIMIIGMMFFVFGFATWINAMLIPYFKMACELSHFQSYLVTFAFYISYLVVSVPSSFLLKRIGFKKGMMLGFWVMAAGAFVFIPAAQTRTYGLFLCGLFLIGIGLSVLQTAANPYVTILGAKDRAAQRISIMGICNKTAGIIAPLLLAAAILRPGDNTLFQTIQHMGMIEKSKTLDALIRRVILPYACVGIVLTILGFAVRFSPLPEIENFKDEETPISNALHDNIFGYPHLILGAVAIFLHVGSQILAIDSIISYAQGMGISMMEAKVFPSYTLFATICGYLLGISLIPWGISQVNALRFCTLLGVVLSSLVVTTRGTRFFLGHHADISIWFLVLLGFANSMIWAGIWPLALDRLGAHLKLGASILIMGLCGNAIVPLLYGYFADKYSLQMGYWVLLPCYVYLVFYAFYGYKIKSWKLHPFLKRSI
jgi:MFS transporter, FHS family, L-fucose permease